MASSFCSVKYCMSSRDSDVKFHRFPPEEERARLWLQACDRPELLDKPPSTWKSMYICSRHFDKTMYMTWSASRIAMKKYAIPTLLLAGNDMKYCSTQTDMETFSQASQTPWKLETTTREGFMKSSDKFLSPKLSSIVKAECLLKRHCKNKNYSRKFKLFCIDLYYSSPRVYSFFSNTICLPSKYTLANMDLMEAKLNLKMWNFLTATVKHMNTSQKQCVLCMGGTSLNQTVLKNTEKDKHGPKRPEGATYAFTLMLRGLVTDWKQPIGFTFISSNNIEDQLKPWILSTARRLFHIGFNIRVVVSDHRTDFLQFSKTLGISKDRTWFEIDGKKVYYIFNVPHLMKSARNVLLNHNFEFDGKVAQWIDIKHMYEIDKARKMRSVPRLTSDHVSPKGIQKRKLRFAVQVFSDSVATALKNFEIAGALELADGTVNFVETMNDLFDLLNSSEIYSCLSSSPFTNARSQKELLEKAQCLFDAENLKIKKRTNGRDVTSCVKFIEGFNVTLNSVQQLFHDMKLDGYKCLFTRRLNNDSLEEFFTVVRQSKGKHRNPTPSQFTKAFLKTFVFQLFNLADVSNRTDDFDTVVSQYLEFFKKPEKPKVVEQEEQQEEEGMMLDEGEVQEEVIVKEEEVVKEEIMVLEEDTMEQEREEIMETEQDIEEEELIKESEDVTSMAVASLQGIMFDF